MGSAHILRLDLLQVESPNRERRAADGGLHSIGSHSRQRACGQVVHVLAVNDSVDVIVVLRLNADGLVHISCGTPINFCDAERCLCRWAGRGQW